MTETDTEIKCQDHEKDADQIKEKEPIINCHTHIFTGDHVPPFLARSLVRWPFYYVINFKWVFYFFRKFYSKRDKKRFDGTDNLKARTKFEKRKKFRQQYLLYWIVTIIALYATLLSADILCHWLFDRPQKPTWFTNCLIEIDNLLHKVLLPLK